MPKRLPSLRMIGSSVMRGSLSVTKRYVWLSRSAAEPMLSASWATNRHGWRLYERFVLVMPNSRDVLTVAVKSIL